MLHISALFTLCFIIWLNRLCSSQVKDWLQMLSMHGPPLIDWLICSSQVKDWLPMLSMHEPSFEEPNLLIKKTCTFEATVVCWANGSFMVRHYPKLQSAWSKSFMGNSDPWPALRASNPSHLPKGMPKYLKKNIWKLEQRNVVFQSIADTRTPCRMWKATNPLWRGPKFVKTLLRFYHGCWQ